MNSIYRQRELYQTLSSTETHNDESAIQRVDGPVQCMELTAATFHQQRRDLVDCLRFLLKATEAFELPDAPIVYQRLGTFVKAELLLGPRSGVPEPTMTRNMFKEIEQLDILIGKADAARKNAGTE
jgi:nuclear pore complex protein Nup205